MTAVRATVRDLNSAGGPRRVISPISVQPQSQPQASPAYDRGAALQHLMTSIADNATTLRLPRREMVYGSCGCANADSEPSVYLVERGYVKVVAPSRDGKECLLGILTAGDLVGELCLVDDDHAESVMTMTPAVLRRISRARLMALLENTGAREEFVGYLAQRLLDQQRLITDFVTADSQYRLAAILMHLARKIGRPNGPLLVINARITQEEFAAMVGTTRSRVGLFLKRFVESGLVLKGRQGVLAVHEEHLEDFIDAA